VVNQGQLVWLASVLVAGIPAQLAGQAPALDALSRRLMSIPAPLGYESALADSIAGLLQGRGEVSRDRAGNVVLKVGRGSPERLVACPMDEPGWVVGGMRDDGYLTIRRLPGSMPRDADERLEGQRITLLGSKGLVPGVVGVRSIHLTRGRSSASDRFTFDDAYVDVGARSADEARALGLDNTTPLVLEKRPHAYGEGLLAAPEAGARAACAALVRAAMSSQLRGTVTVAFVVEQRLSARGLRSIIHERGPFADVLLLGAADSIGNTVAADSVRMSEAGRIERWRIRVRHQGTPVETVSMSDAAAMETRLAAWIRGGSR
jgi:putative aminopeptidase FrvX